MQQFFGKAQQWEGHAVVICVGSTWTCPHDTGFPEGSHAHLSWHPEPLIVVRLGSEQHGFWLSKLPT